jgi:hypothetical protein
MILHFVPTSSSNPDKHRSRPILDLLYERRNVAAQTLAGSRTAQIGRDDPCAASFQRSLDRAHHRVSRFLVTEMLEQHLARPNHAYRVGDALAGNVGCAAVHWLEEGWPASFGVDVARGGDADGPSARRAKIREDVSEEVAAENQRGEY